MVLPAVHLGLYSFWLTMSFSYNVLNHAQSQVGLYVSAVSLESRSFVRIESQKASRFFLLLAICAYLTSLNLYSPATAFQCLLWLLPIYFLLSHWFFPLVLLTEGDMHSGFGGSF